LPKTQLIFSKRHNRCPAETFDRFKTHSCHADGLAMGERETRAGIWIWSFVLLAIGGICFTIGGPFLNAWRCYERAAGGEPAEATVISAETEVGVVLQLTSGSQVGSACTVKVSKTYAAELQAGDTLAVFSYADRPGDCELADTIEASGALLWVIGSVVAIILLFLVLLGITVQRKFSQTPVLTTRFDSPGSGMNCPRCGSSMNEGYLVPAAGIHWRNAGQPLGLPHALGGLPGTVGWKGRPRLHAYRCESCEISTFHYGKKS
jgi:hypothetical protein